MNHEQLYKAPVGFSADQRCRKGKVGCPPLSSRYLGSEAAELLLARNARH